jgi:hypothetical protein
VTICTANREYFFGEVVDGEMKLSVIGKTIAYEWQKTETIRRNVQLDAWVVMPNHLHGIVVIAVETPQYMCRAFSHSTPLHKTFQQNPAIRTINPNGNLIHWGQSSINSNLFAPNKSAKQSLLILPGSPDFMIRLFAMKGN